MAALFTSNTCVRLGTSTSTLLDGGGIQSICGRNFLSVSKTRPSPSPNRGDQSNNVTRKSSSDGKGSVTKAAVISDVIQEAGSSQQRKLRDRVSGFKTRVRNLSVPWWSEETSSSEAKGNSDQNQASNGINNNNTITLEQLVSTSSSDVIVNNSDIARDFKDVADLSDTETKTVQEQWVAQLLEIHNDKSNPHTLSDEILDQIKRSNSVELKSTTTEKLEDPLAQIDTTVISTKKVNKEPVKSSFSSRINFSYFTTKPKNSTKSLKKSLEEKKAKNGTNTSNNSANQGPSRMGRILNAVNFSSSSKKNGDEPVNKETFGEDGVISEKQIETLKDKTLPKAPADSDWSYWSMLSNLQQSVLLNLPLSSGAKTGPGADNPSQINQVPQNIVPSEFKSESALLLRTRSLVDNLLTAESTMSKLKRMDELCTHLTKYPHFRNVALQHKVLQCLLQMCKSDNPKVKARANEALALIGYIAPPKGRGIRMLSIDGGGTRGLIAIEMMQRIEKLCNRPINEMFDFVTGSSTGALMAALVFIFKIPLPECKEMYLDRSARMFVKESLLSKTKNMALHDVKIFEAILQAEMGNHSLISTSRDPTIAKFAATSTLANVPKWKTFLFRNYNHPAGVSSDYEGSCNLKVWEAVRASGSAPVYYSPFQIGENIFRDGGCLANNPTAVGVHECKLLWPHESFQCVLSLGNGRYDPSLAKEVKTKTGYSVIPKSMKDLADGFIDSATDTEGVHLILKNTLDPSSYFRLSPYLCENYELSEVRPDKIKQMLGEAKAYLDRNDVLIQKLANKLKQERLPNQKLLDFTMQRKQTHDYFIF